MNGATAVELKNYEKVYFATKLDFLLYDINALINRCENLKLKDALEELYSHAEMIESDLSCDKFGKEF